MKIDVCSDLHADAWLYGKKNGNKIVKYIDWDTYKNSDSTVLVVAGDTSNNITTTLNIMEEASSIYDLVVFVDGNHEHYDSSSSVLESQIQLQLACRAISPNIVYLSGDYFDFNGIRFTGGCGWYTWDCYEDIGISKFNAIDAWKDMSNDYYHVSIGIPHIDDTTHPIEWLARQHTQGIKSASLDANNNANIKSVVVITHTSPSEKLMQWKTKDMDWNLLTPSYVNSNMNEIWEDDHKISHWVYGHTHNPSIVELPDSSIQFVNNARGYPGELPPGYKFTQIEV
jgi:predicted phosphodiesterase